MTLSNASEWLSLCFAVWQEFSRVRCRMTPLAARCPSCLQQLLKVILLCFCGTSGEEKRWCVLGRRQGLSLCWESEWWICSLDSTSLFQQTLMLESEPARSVAAAFLSCLVWWSNKCCFKYPDPHKTCSPNHSSIIQSKQQWLVHYRFISLCTQL